MMNEIKKNRLLILLAVMVILTGVIFGLSRLTPATEPPVVPGETERTTEVEPIETKVLLIDNFGNVVITLMNEQMKQLGYEAGDIITVKMGSYEADMPIVGTFSDVDSFNPACLYRQFYEYGEVVMLAINSGNLAATADIAKKHDIAQDPGYEWEFNDEYGGKDVSVHISMKQKEGYLDEYLARSMDVISTRREDFPDLDDKQFANFRMLSGGQLGRNALFRSSSPIDPELGRNKIADDAIREAGVKTILNLDEIEETMKAYPGYDSTYYSGCDILGLNLSMDLKYDSFKELLAEGYRFMIDHQGPYLIHCLEGKDRTGYVTAILESLMGVPAEDIVKDYMLTFVYLYQVEPGSARYEKIASANIEMALAAIFDVDSIYADGVDLAEKAYDFLLYVGLSSEEIDKLKDDLARDYE